MATGKFVIFEQNFAHRFRNSGEQLLMGTASRKKKATIDFFTGWDDGLEGICNEIVYASRAEKKVLFKRLQTIVSIVPV